ncbi:Na+/H+ antiporter [Paraburkholderia sp.]|uniref:Na+/H+ antiporter n=1 Tax=Paraburkholderia sp. TaxID=1926495 RepID=UPI0023868BB2|nr:Na+/H+ antiporter [Paraburkholderia sp.]MDE1178997.1 Na+/H+ antiporter [Paraburkholderia sp.]
MNHIVFFQDLLLVLLGACVLSLIASRFNLPSAAVLLVGGAAIGFATDAPVVELDPDVIMVVLIPPLLMSGAFYTAWRDFRRETAPIASLALGSVIFTTASVACVAHWIDPQLSWAACAALGAIVSPPDAVAAKALLGKLPLPERLITVLEGESLVNDASGLVIYRFAVAALAAGTFSASDAAVTFSMLSLIGVVTGGVTGWVTIRLVTWLEDTHLAVVLTFLAAWAAYLLGERLHGSGVLSVVVCGLIVGLCQHKTFDATTRLKITGTWDVVVFVLEALVFILIGLSLRGTLASLGAGHTFTWWLPEQVWQVAGATVAVVIVARIVWVMAAILLPEQLLARVRGTHARTDLKQATILGWAGMRGVVSLAAALALPESLADRHLLIFSTFAVIFVTVVVQGLTLAPLARRVGFRDVRTAGESKYMTQYQARSYTFQAALDALRQIDLAQCKGNEDVVLRLIDEYTYRVDSNARAHSGGENLVHLRLTRLNLGLRAVQAARTALLQLHEDNRIKDKVLHRIESELDLEEARLKRLLGA